MSVPTSTDLPIALERIDVGGNVRELNSEHVDALAGSIAVIGLLSPLTVRPAGERFELVAGFHRHAACTKLNLEEVPVTVRDVEAASADRAVENVLSCRGRHDTTYAECDGMPTWA